MSKFKQISYLKFEFDCFHPELSSDEVRSWLAVNKIDYEYIYIHGPREIYDRAYLRFKNKEDAMAFKLVWM